jgi:putative lipoprotein
MPAISPACLLAVAMLATSGCAPLPAHKDPWSGIDKVQHFAFSTVMSAAIAQASLNDGRSDCAAMRLGVGWTMAIGAGKEVFDAQIRHAGWSWRDLVADAAGAMAGGLIVTDCR